MQELVWYIGMQRNAHKELKKRSQYIYIGFLFVLIAFFIGTLDYWDTKKIHAWDSVNTKLFFEQHPEDKEVLEEQIVQVSEEELPENTTESTNSEPTVANYYVGYLEIPKINLKRGFAAFGSPYNNVDKNVTILPTSVYPDVELGNFILAGHSGQGSLAFFNDLYKLKHGDQAIVYYKNVKYTYEIVDIYQQDKTGVISIYRDYNKNTLTLVTCTNNTKDKQTVYIANLVNKQAY